MNKWTFPTQIYAGPDSLIRLTEFNNESILIICVPIFKRLLKPYVCDKSYGR